MIYLASQSPRRTELLRQIGVEHKVHVSPIDESRLVSESPDDYVCRMAQSKARVALAELSGMQHDCLVLAADTTIELDGDIIGKPSDPGHCGCILKKLSGRQHRVLTAVALATTDGLDYRLSSNRVSFRELSDTEIEAYCASAEPIDKAGAYAIQGKAAVFIDRLEGSYSAVMGLPLLETAQLLGEADIEIF